MDIQIPYGHGAQTLRCDGAELRAVLRCNPPPAAVEPLSLVESALSSPIGSQPLELLAKDRRRALIITSDHTRPVPSGITLPAMLKRLRAGNEGIEVKILVATGVHRAPTEDELENKFSKDITERETVLIHNAFESEMTELGTLPSGAELSVNSLVRWADIVLADGFIEPHFFAGFSGGRKSVLPGIASAASVMGNHCASLIGSPFARAGALCGNPIHEDMTAAARLAGLEFILNVVLDDNKRIIAAFAGDTVAAHSAACEYSRDIFDIDAVKASVVVTSNGATRSTRTCIRR